MSDRDRQNGDDEYTSTRRQLLAFGAMATMTPLSITDWDFDLFGPDVEVIYQNETILEDPSRVVVGNGLTAAADENAGELTLTTLGGGGGGDVTLSGGDVTLSSETSYVLGRLPADSHPTGTLAISTAGISNSAFNVPTGVELRVMSGGSILHKVSSTKIGNVEATVDVDGRDIHVELWNGSGSSETLSGFFSGDYI